MDLVGEVQKIADANGDGKLSVEDLDSLKQKFPDQADLLDKAKAIADQNGDGKIDLADMQGFDLSSLGEKLGGLFK